MDLTQSRLSRNEWEAIEVPVTAEEERVGRMLLEAAHDPGMRRNRAQSLATYLQIARSPATSQHFWTEYLQPELAKGMNGCTRSTPMKMGFGRVLSKGKPPALRSADRIRLRNASQTLCLPGRRETIFEFVLIDLIKAVYHARTHGGPRDWLTPYYALRTLRGRSVVNLHEALMNGIDAMTAELDKEVMVRDLVLQAATAIERNDALLRHADDQLFEHQRALLETLVDEDAVFTPKLVLLTAPTGTGKTVCPVAVAERRRVVFVCAARHVGIALAKLAVSLEKKVAFAFGCDSPEDIRLHYYAATDCIRSRRSGRIVKVDNTAGENVEIMICDVRSCPVASEYMLGFNEPEDLVLYWDEPTIALDYADHPCHPVIQAAWAANQIPTVVLSSATLPTTEEMEPTCDDFQKRFPGAQIVPLASYECRKSIPLVGRGGQIVMPHDLGRSSWGGAVIDASNAAARCLENKTLLRHIDLGVGTQFIAASLEVLPRLEDELKEHFPTVDSVTAQSAKCFYLRCVQAVAEDPAAFAETLSRCPPPAPAAGPRVMTKDAHTLTGGPTIFLADNVDVIARFCIKDAAIPADILQKLGEKVAQNERLRQKLDDMQMEYEDGTQKDEGKGHDRKLASGRVDPSMKRLLKNMDAVRALVKPAAVNPVYVPNTPEHQARHVPDCAPTTPASAPFAPSITEETVETVMLVDGVDDKWKLLLLLGVGVFAPWNSPSYTEIMKSLAQQQKLFMVVATSDYIYGTNYQFCHGYIAKDLGAMSQEKCIQAMGRVGRNRLQQTYSIRFRDDDLIKRLFRVEENRPEVANMRKLFVQKSG